MDVHLRLTPALTLAKGDLFAVRVNSVNFHTVNIQECNSDATVVTKAAIRQ